MAELNKQRSIDIRALHLAQGWTTNFRWWILGYALSQVEATHYHAAAYNSFTNGYSARLTLFTQCGLTSRTTFIVTAEMTTTLGEVHVHFIENSMTLDSLHWRMDATKLTLRNEMPPRTSPKLKQSVHIVCKISRRRKPSHDDHDSNQVLKLSMHLLEDL